MIPQELSVSEWADLIESIPFNSKPRFISNDECYTMTRRDSVDVAIQLYNHFNPPNAQDQRAGPPAG